MVCSAKSREIVIWDWKKNLPIKLQQVIKKGLFTQRHSIEKYLHKPQTKMGSPLVLILFGLVIATSQVSAQVAWGSAGLATKLIFPYRFFAKIINLPEGQIQHYFTLIVNCIKQTESNWFSDQVERAVRVQVNPGTPLIALSLMDRDGPTPLDAPLGLWGLRPGSDVDLEFCATSADVT